MIVKDIAKRLGHTTEVLSRVYTHSNEEDDKKIVDKIEQSFYGENNKFNLSSIVSIISGNINNEFKEENYKLLDYLTNDKVSTDNVDKYLFACQSYLLKQFSILDSFAYEDVSNNKDNFNNKLESYKKFLGNNVEVNKNEDELSFDNIKI